MTPPADAVVPLVLAAGASERMGRPKAALPFGPTTALDLVLTACRSAGLGRAIVVTGAHPAAVREAATATAAADFIENPIWRRGRTTSLQAGLGALPADAEAFLLWPVDVPLPGAGVAAALLEARAARPDRLAWVPSHARRRGHPALFSRTAAPRFQALGPDEPARDVVRALHAEGALEHVLVHDPAVLWDMDTPAEYERLRAEHGRRA